MPGLLFTFFVPYRDSMKLPTLLNLDVGMRMCRSQYLYATILLNSAVKGSLFLYFDSAMCVRPRTTRRCPRKAESPDDRTERMQLSTIAQGSVSNRSWKLDELFERRAKVIQRADREPACDGPLQTNETRLRICSIHFILCIPVNQRHAFCHTLHLRSATLTC